MAEKQRFSDRRRLLAVGNTYPGGSALSTPINAAEQIAHFLKERGDFEFCWETSSGGPENQNVKLVDLEGLLVRLFGQAESNPAETAVFFFSGHGVGPQADSSGHELSSSSPGEFCLITSDNNFLRLSRLRDLITRSCAKNILLILDCCHSGGMINSLLELQNGLPKDKQVVIFTASQWHEPSHESNVSHFSYFMHYLATAAVWAEPDQCGYVTPVSWWAAFNRAWNLNIPGNAWNAIKKAISQNPDNLIHGGNYRIYYKGLGADSVAFFASAPLPALPANLGNARLPPPLVSGFEPPSEQPHPAALLRPGFELVPFSGRTQEIQELDFWNEDNRKGSVRLICSSGGSGKTRLAIEWLRKCRKEGNFVAGFVPRIVGSDDYSVPSAELKRQNAELCALIDDPTTVPLILAFDYAEQRTNQIEQVLEQHLRGVSGVKRPLRMLLISRTTGEWWDNLGNHSPAMRSLVDSAKVQQLAKKSDWKLAAMFEEACQRAAKLLDIPEPDLGKVTLSSPLLMHPLYLGIAACALVKENKLLRREEDVLPKAVEHELEYLSKAVAVFASGSDRQSVRQKSLERVLERVVALITLWGGVRLESAEQAIALCAKNILSEETLGIHIKALRRLLVGFIGKADRSGWILSGMEPDLLGEELVSQVVAKNDDLLDLAFNNANNGQIRNSLTVLNRRAARFLLYSGDDLRERRANPSGMDSYFLKKALEKRLSSICKQVSHVARRSTDAAPIGAMVNEILLETNDYEVAESLLKSCKDYPISLREAIVTASAILVDRCQTLLTSDRNDGYLEVQLAYAYKQLASALSATGRKMESVRPVWKALSIFKRLDRKYPGTYTRHLFDTRLRLSIFLRSLRKKKRAHIFYRAIAVFCCEEALRNPSIENSINYAIVLADAGYIACEVGDIEEGLKELEKSVDSLRKLYETKCDNGLLCRLADAMDKHSCCLSDCFEKRGESLRVQRECIQLWKKLTNEEPGIHNSGYGRALSNLALRLKENDRYDEAEKAFLEAIEIRKDLAKRLPLQFNTALARTLNNYSIYLGQCKRFKEATERSIEAIELLRSVLGEAATNRSYEKTHHALVPQWAKYHQTLADQWEQLGENRNALEAEVEAMRCWQRLAEVKSDVFAVENLECMERIARRYSVLGMKVEALETIDKAIQKTRICRATAYDCVKLARPHHIRAMILATCGKIETAIAALKEAYSTLLAGCDFCDEDSCKPLMEEVQKDYRVLCERFSIIPEEAMLIFACNNRYEAEALGIYPEDKSLEPNVGERKKKEL